MGSDSGIRRIYEDTTVVNVRKYYYAVTAFDRGLEQAGISPSESPVQISLNPDGSVDFGQNVLEVRASREQAGYISPSSPLAAIYQGAPGGTVEVEVIDPTQLKADNLYEVVFEDTLLSGGSNPDTLKTKNFSLRNITTGSPDTLLSRFTSFNGGGNPVTEGFTVRVTNIESFGLNEARSGWFTGDAEAMDIHGFSFITQAAPKVSDYELIVGDNVGFGQSVEKEIEVATGFFQTLPSIPTNFKVVNTYTGEEAKYAFADLNVSTSFQQRCNQTIIVPGNYTPPEPGHISAVAGFSGRCSDVLFLIEDFRGVEDTLTYKIEMAPLLINGNLETRNPVAGDTLKIFTTKPFSSNDIFRFRFDSDNVPRIDADSAAS